MKVLMQALTLILLGIVIASGQNAAHGAKRPAEWTLNLKTSGAPWTAKFQVELDQSGKLTMTTHDPQHEQNAGVSKFSVKLSAMDAKEIYEQVLMTFRKFRFSEAPSDRVDGTNLSLSLAAYEKSLQLQISGMGNTEHEEPELGRILVLINKHLPKEVQMY